MNSCGPKKPRPKKPSRRGHARLTHTDAITCSASLHGHHFSLLPSSLLHASHVAPARSVVNQLLHARDLIPSSSAAMSVR